MDWITIVTAIPTASTRNVVPTRVAAANRKADPAISTVIAAPYNATEEATASRPGYGSREGRQTQSSPSRSGRKNDGDTRRTLKRQLVILVST